MSGFDLPIWLVCGLSDLFDLSPLVEVLAFVGRCPSRPLVPWPGRILTCSQTEARIMR